MDDFVSWLNQNQGAVMATLTLVYVLFTGALLLEARSGRVEKLTASVEAYPMLYELMHMYLTGRVENGGPAVARDLEWTVSLRDGEKAIGDPRRYAQPLIGAGKYRTMMLDPRDAGQATTLNKMATDGVVIDVKWSWTDGRRRWPFGPHTKHERTATWDCKQLVQDFYQAHVLTETPPMLKVGQAADEVRKTMSALPKIEQRLDRLTRLVEEAKRQDSGETEPE